MDSRTVLDAVLIRSGDLQVSRREVLGWAERFDPNFPARALRRAALGALGEEVAAEAVESAAAEFRYERELESPEALTGWLAQRGLTVEGWWEAIRRNVLEEHLAGLPVIESDDTGADSSMVDVEADADAESRQKDAEEGTEAGAGVDEETWLAELVLGDLLAAPIEALVRRIAVARGTSGWKPPAPDTGLVAWHESLEAVWRAWREPLMSESRLQAAVDRERLTWLVLDLVESHWPNEDAAREAIACVRYDGADLLEIAGAAGVPAVESVRLLADLPPKLHDGLLTAAPGEVVGPVEHPQCWTVVVLSAKRAPTLADPLVRAAAERAVESHAVLKLVEQHITSPLPLG